jgi:acyl-CoA synthetase (AMP-forming)/AMP-acid ligase II/thioesterase domain-containing protein/acyl carrier protein
MTSNSSFEHDMRSAPRQLSITGAVRAARDHAPGSTVLLAPGRSAATYDDLLDQLDEVARHLRAAGIARSGRVAVSLPNGPDAAVALLGTATAAVCAPLAPDLPEGDVANQLTALGARALVVQREHDTAARAAAAALGTPVIELVAGDTAGTFALAGPASSDGAPAEREHDADAVLLLFTSGTTGSPKLVPLTERNLLTSAANVAATLRLGPADRCLNVMPLFHIHGLVAALLGSIVAGGSIVCTAGFRARDVPGWIDEYRPTWYTAVPTIHQAMLDVARTSAAAGRALPATFRFVRSSSAALPVPVLRNLEATFGVPVIEAYGMTEAAHQMTSNPLPDEVRKPGTVGRAAGPEVAVLDATGRVLPAGSTGEVAIRGDSVMSGYLDDPGANHASFVDGWFRTGDQGSFDVDGYLTITGRLKELINRGGEKVAPREIDLALLEHPDVVEAAAFAIPHDRLGEDVAAAVVLREGAEVTTSQLRTFVGERLAPYKVPRRVSVVAALPRGRTGKIERSNLARSLGVDGSTAGVRDAAVHVEATDDVERTLCAIWQRVLGLDSTPSTDREFLELGDSLHATELLVDVEDAFGRPLPATVFLTGATVRDMAEALRGAATSGRGASVLPVRAGGARPPLFCLLRGGAEITVRHLAAAVGPDQPVYAVLYPAMHGPPDAAGSLQEIAAECAAAIRAVRPDGPYLLFGHSLGAIVFYETARRLAASGGEIGLVVLADGPHPRIADREWRRYRSVRHRARNLASRQAPAIVARRIRRLVGKGVPDRPPAPTAFIPGTDILDDHATALERERYYVPGPAAGPVVIFATQEYLERAGGPDLGWGALLTEGWQSVEVPGDHNSMIAEPHVHVLAARLAECLEHAGPGASSTGSVVTRSGRPSAGRIGTSR